jgi:hypothetical protein
MSETEVTHWSDGTTTQRKLRPEETAAIRAKQRTAVRFGGITAADYSPAEEIASDGHAVTTQKSGAQE